VIFLEICDDRYQRRSTILTSQLPVAHWHARIGDPTFADSIMDRLVHNAYRIELSGESMRKQRGRKRTMTGMRRMEKRNNAAGPITATRSRRPIAISLD
jgi:hypothetical protein